MDNLSQDPQYTYLDHLSTQELEDLLRADIAESENDDPELVLHVMEVIARREDRDSEENAADARRALKDFYKIYNTPEGVGQSLYPADDLQKSSGQACNTQPQSITAPKLSRHRFRRILTAAVAAAAIIVLLIPSALGYEGFYEMVGQWSDSVFEFVRGANDVSDLPDDSSKGYLTLQEALEDYDITDAPIPTAIPDGFKLQAIDVNGYSSWLEFHAFYTKEDATLTLSVVSHSTPKSSKYEKRAEPMQSLVLNGITFYLLLNTDQCTATWYKDALECSIYGDITFDEIEMMIGSI